MQSSIPLIDKDLRLALNFMITTATILEEMTRDMIKQPALGLNYQTYQNKIKRYEPTYNGMMEDFYDDIFGEYSNRSSKD